MCFCAKARNMSTAVMSTPMFECSDPIFKVIYSTAILNLMLYSRLARKSNFPPRGGNIEMSKIVSEIYEGRERRQKHSATLEFFVL